jgi:simple sugar transport system permease protein
VTAPATPLVTGGSGATRPEPVATTGRLPGKGKFILAAVLVLFLLSVARATTNSPDVTSSGTFGAALRLAIPILLAGLGGIYAERCGVVNIGLEGMMIMGTWFGAWAGWQYGPWWGVVAGVGGGAAGGLIHAIATVTFDVNHIVSGVAINILGAGVARFLSSLVFTPDTGGGITQSPGIQGRIGKFSMPFVAGGRILGWRSPDVSGWLERHRWFFLSDVGGMVKGLTGDVSLLTILSVALVPLSAWLLWRTRFGLRLRSVGENPGAAESLGVPVYTMKYIGVVISGGLAGLGGAFLVLISSGIYKEGQTNGRGFIGLAAMIFGNWMPSGVAVGAGLFGFADALQLRSNKAVHALLLTVAIGLLVLAVLWAVRRKVVRAAICAVLGSGFLVWFLTSSRVPEQFVGFTPHLVTVLVLALASQRLRAPAADGLPYRKGQVQ